MDLCPNFLLVVGDEHPNFSWRQLVQKYESAIDLDTFYKCLIQLFNNIVNCCLHVYVYC